MPQHLHGHRALTGDDERVVERMDEDAARGRRERLAARLGIGVAVAVQHDLGAEVAHRAHLDGRRGLGHDDEGGKAEVAGRVGHALRVVAGARRDDAAAAFAVVEVRHAVVGAAQLEAEDRLHVFALEEHLAAQARREPAGRVERCFVGHVVDAARQDGAQQGRVIGRGRGGRQGHGAPTITGKDGAAGASPCTTMRHRIVPAP